MKLVEILAKKLDVWPTGAAIAVQDGDARKTVKFGSKHANPSIALMGLKDVWQARDWKYTYQSDFDHSVLASDWKTSIVTHDQWKAERDRQKGGEWKRHRSGRKQPLPDHTKIEVKFRDGEIHTVMSDRVDWIHYGHGSDLMQYRIISQPQAEEVEMKDTSIGTISYKISVDQIAGPLAWRDTIIHCQAIIEDCEREIERNVNLLDAEGLMMQKDSKKAMQHYAQDVDMSDWRNWKAGDIVEATEECSRQYSIGTQYKIRSITSFGTIRTALDDCGNNDNGWNHSNFKFVRRP